MCHHHVCMKQPLKACRWDETPPFAGLHLTPLNTVIMTKDLTLSKPVYKMNPYFFYFHAFIGSKEDFGEIFAFNLFAKLANHCIILAHMMGNQEHLKY